jgi:hypothetical protein
VALGIIMLIELQNKNADIAGIADKASHDSALLSDLIEGLKLKVSPKSGEETVRYNCFKTLMSIGISRPELIYHAWDGLVEMLRSKNAYYKMAAVQLIASLVKADAGNKFERILDEYYGLLDDESVIVAIYVASASGRIVPARPALENVVTGKLLGIEATHHTPNRKALIAAGAIEAFGQYFEVSVSKDLILEFVMTWRSCESPKTRKLAKDFLKKW